MFHPATGLQKLRDRWRQATAEEALQRLMARCRRAVRRAGKRMRAQRAADDHGLVRMARTSLEKLEDADTQVKRVRAALFDRAPGGKMDVVHPGDDLSRPGVPAHDPRFLDTLGAVGEGMVEALDEGCVPEAYAAWCLHFGAHYDEIPGADGGDWLIARELTFRLFRRCLAGMPRNKAVGSGGWSVSLLLAAGRELPRGRGSARGQWQRWRAGSGGGGGRGSSG